MKMTMQSVRGIGAFDITDHDAAVYRAQNAGEVSCPGKEAIRQQHDRFGDIESVRSMEERYSIKDEGRF